jgi:hypothetical protein
LCDLPGKDLLLSQHAGIAPDQTVICDCRQTHDIEERAVVYR